MCLIYPLNIFNLKRQGYAEGVSQAFKDVQSQDAAQITCQNCGINEIFLDANIRSGSKIYMSNVLYTRNDGSHVRGLLCFNCNYVSEFMGAENIGEIEYIKHYKLDNETEN